MVKLWPAENEVRDLTDTTLAVGTGCQISLALSTPQLERPEENQDQGPMVLSSAGTNAAPCLLAETTASNSIVWPTGEGPDGPWLLSLDEEQRSVGTWRGVWSPAYRRALGTIFVGALLAMSMALGILAPGPTIAPLFHLPAGTLSAHPGASTTPPAAAAPGGKEVVMTGPAPDARFAIAALSVHCMLNPCDEVQYVAAGQRIYPRQEGVPCTTISGIAVVGHSERYVYCRLDQPNVYTYNFDAAQFDCVGSQLGCHTVMVVDTTNGR
jgi:hypothetical protein